MNPRALAEYLDGLVRHNLKLSTMLWGPPGIASLLLMPALLVFLLPGLILVLLCRKGQRRWFRRS